MSPTSMPTSPHTNVATMNLRTMSSSYENESSATARPPGVAGARAAPPGCAAAAPSECVIGGSGGMRGEPCGTTPATPRASAATADDCVTARAGCERPGTCALRDGGAFSDLPIRCPEFPYSASRALGSPNLRAPDPLTSMAMTFSDYAVAGDRPMIIQGGMGAGVSNWMLARAVSLQGQLGVVSGTVIDTIFVRRLQDGDRGGHLRRAMAHFPCPAIAEAALSRYFHPEGRASGVPYKALPTYKQVVSAARQQLTMLASFVEVWLAKEGHSNPVGINLLTKVQMPNLATLYGAMLAGVDVVLMGAGIPREIPGALDALAVHQPAVIRFDVEGGGDAEYLTFDPGEHGAMVATLKRPQFYPIIAATSLAMTLARKANGRVDGFVIEGPTAGGHNAPPRGELKLSASGEPVYGERDVVDLAKIRELGLPFWLAGGTGSPEGLRAALDAGAAGIQVGTLFAFSDDSGITPEIKEEVLAGVNRGEVNVRTDARASPTGYPFKVVEMEGGAYQKPDRERICDLGYLRIAYRKEEGGLGYRCAAEPVDAYVAKGGAVEETAGRRCLCNALLANIGHAQVRPRWDDELPLLTSGDDLMAMAPFLKGRTRYAAAEVLEYLLAGEREGAVA